MALQIDLLSSVYKKLTDAFDLSKSENEGISITSKIKRSSQSVTVTQLIPANIPTDGTTFTYGQIFDIGDAERVLLELATTNFTKGSLAGLKCSVQALSVVNASAWYNIPINSEFLVNPIVLDPPAIFTNIFGAYYIPPYFQLIRVGFTSTATFTSGQISAILTIKK